MAKYAFKNRKIKESYLRKYTPRGTGWKASKASRGNCIQQSRQEPEEIEITLQSYDKVVQLAEPISYTGEENGRHEEESAITHQEGLQGIQESDSRGEGRNSGTERTTERRQETDKTTEKEIENGKTRKRSKVQGSGKSCRQVRSRKSSSSSSRSRNEEIRSETHGENG